jgi:hypothetical protein
MRIHLVNYEQGVGINAILSKYARLLGRELTDLGHEVTISEKPEKADINHHINYISYVPSGGKDTTMITHLTGDKNISEKEKIALAKKQEKTAVGICMNEDIWEKLVKNGCDPKRLFVSGHAHDSMVRRPLIVAMVFNIYPDGRKREEMVLKLVKSLKDKNDVLFRVMGTGWIQFLKKIKNANFQGMDTFTGDLYQQFLLTSDYLLYTGDEDSLAQSVIDAKQVGLRVIAPPRKELHIDYPFETQEELNGIFQKLLENEVEEWTWTNFAKRHLDVWEKL